MHVLTHLVGRATDLALFGLGGGSLAVTVVHLFQTGVAADPLTAVGGAGVGLALGGLALRFNDQATTRWDLQQESYKKELLALLARGEKREDRLLRIIADHTRVMQSLLERLGARGESVDTDEADDEAPDRRR